MDPSLAQGSAISILCSIKCPYTVEPGPDIWKFILIPKHLDVNICCSQTLLYLRALMMLPQMCNHKRGPFPPKQVTCGLVIPHNLCLTHSVRMSLARVSGCSLRLALLFNGRALTLHIQMQRWAAWWTSRTHLGISIPEWCWFEYNKARRT